MYVEITKKEYRRERLKNFVRGLIPLIIFQTYFQYFNWLGSFSCLELQHRFVVSFVFGLASGVGIGNFFKKVDRYKWVNRPFPESLQ